jgi:hypothetical protein
MVDSVKTPGINNFAGHGFLKCNGLQIKVPSDSCEVLHALANKGSGKDIINSVLACPFIYN